MAGIDQWLAGLGKVSPQLSVCEVGSQAGRYWSAQAGGQLRRFPGRGFEGAFVSAQWVSQFPPEGSDVVTWLLTVPDSGPGTSRQCKHLAVPCTWCYTLLSLN